MKPEIVQGDLLDQKVDVLVNAWNRNVIPWWLLVPQGVSRAIKRHAGYAPFRELARYGPMSLGSAMLTSPGRLPLRGIIHVAGINLLWRASNRSIADSVHNAMVIVIQHGFRSVAFPIIGAGSGGYRPGEALEVMLGAFEAISYDGLVRIVEYVPFKGTQ